MVGVILEFCDYYVWFNGRLAFLINGAKSGAEDWSRAYDGTGLMVGVTDVAKQVGVFETVWMERVRGMLSDLGYFGSVDTVKFGNLGVRLDYNGYYSK